MATYYNENSDIQGGGGGGGGGDGLQTLILMNPPSYIGYQDNQPQPQPPQENNLEFSTTVNHHSHSTQTQPFIGTPLQAGFLPRIHHYNNNNNNTSYNSQIHEPQQGGGLSLTLSSQNPPVSFNGGTNQSVISNSKYLKAAQELLEEIVNVGNGGKIATAAESSKNVNGESSDGKAENPKSNGAGAGAEITTAERQEIQMKKAKLVNMLDEVDQRYKQYQHQMQIVISWLEQAAGIGSAKTYTALALKTISKQFRCLKDAILDQIRAASKSLGEEEDNSLGTGKIVGSRLKYVDNQIRQQRALQHLGMIQHNAWRPQRGLPEQSVSVLRAWLFEHFLHPYPKDSDKTILAKQTGLTRSQVSNWFINARVRLWKPMVEDMYTEEMKENEKNGTQDITTKNQDSASKLTESPKQHNPITYNTTPTPSSIVTNSGFSLIRSSEIDTITQQSPNNTANSQISIKFGIERQSALMEAPTNFIEGFGSYQIGEMGRFGPDQIQTPYSNNGVSLMLGLPHCENLSITGAHQLFQIGEESNDYSTMNNNTQTSTHSHNVYENINIQNRKRFAAQMLPDFVA